MLNAPVAPYQITPHYKGTLRREHSFVSVEPANLVMSSFKQAEDRDSLIIRLYNPTGRTIEGKVKLSKAVSAAYVVNLNEDRQSKLLLGTEPDILELSVKQNKIITIEVIL